MYECSVEEVEDVFGGEGVNGERVEFFFWIEWEYEYGCCVVGDLCVIGWCI